jgi:hypothetical protein
MATTTSTNPSLITASASLPIVLNDFFVGVILILIFLLLREFLIFFLLREFFFFLIIS